MPRKATYIKFLGTSDVLRLFLSGPVIHLQAIVITSSRCPSSAEGTCPRDGDVRVMYTLSSSRLLSHTPIPGDAIGCSRFSVALSTGLHVTG